MLEDIAGKAKELFLKRVDDFGDDPFGLRRHVPEVEIWARFLLKRHPEADGDIVLLGVWLHDSGHYPLTEKDHAVVGESIAKEFLEGEGYEKDKIGRVMHVVRAHRCRDIPPESVEAKILACADSASHMTDYIYLDIVKDGKYEYVLGKLERDYRDVALFPEVKDFLEPLYHSWKAMLPVFIDAESGLSRVREQ